MQRILSLVLSQNLYALTPLTLPSHDFLPDLQFLTLTCPLFRSVRQSFTLRSPQILHHLETETMSDSNEALEILELTLIPGSLPPVYAVGLVASRITFADQQRRAINIISALLTEGRIRAGDELAVIGAGIAGTTAAVFARQQGLRVTVFEKYDDPFSIQQGSGRWVHPNIFDWPKEGWRDGQTKLPCMNWRADTAGKVIAQLRSQWELALKLPELRWMPGTNVNEFLPDIGTRALVRDSSGQTHGPFHCIVMAAGFGEEPKHSDIDGKPYWRDDDLHQRIRTGGTAIVSGCGDGGLIDAARIVLRDFRHDWLSEIAFMAASDHHLVQELIRVEHDTPSYRDGAELTKATLDVAANDNVVTEIRNRLRSNTRVILNARLNGALTRRACMLNRFIIGQLIKLGAVNYHEGALDLSSVLRIGTKFECSINGSRLEADEIVVRHGPAERPLAVFPKFDEALKPVRAFLMTYSAGVDRTRRRLRAPLPAGTTPTGNTLPQLTSDVLNYLGQSVQSAIQQELIRLQILATVAYQCLEGNLTFRICETTKTHTLIIKFPNENQLLIDSERASGERETATVDLGGSPMTDTNTAENALCSQIPRVIEWLMEEPT